ncbi:MAG: hypothetical protein AAF587_00455 [Bacteroidota bacterium]
MARNILASLNSPKAGNLYGYVLPKALVSISLYQAGSSYYLADAETELIPDPDHQYFFRYNPSIFSSDEIHITFNDSGFLSSIRTSIDDQTGEFVNKLVDLGSAITEIVSVPPSGTRDVPILQLQVDPFDARQLAGVNHQLQRNNETLSLEFKVLGKSDPGEPTSSDNRSGIYCKPMTTVELRLIQDGTLIQSQLLRVPDPHNIHFIEIPQAAWVRTDFEVQFTDYGYPTSINLTKPSSAMAFIGAPLKLVGAIIELPSRLFKFQINYGRAKEDALANQVAMRESMHALQQRLTEMETDKQQGRGIFSNLFGSKDKDNGSRNESSSSSGTVNSGSSSSSSTKSNSGSSQTLDADVENTIKKLQQDLKVMRQRMNMYEKTLSEKEEG